MTNVRKPSRKLTWADAVSIWKRWLQTREFQNRIAAEYDVNPGRINEILKGKRHPGSMLEALNSLSV